MEEIKFIDTLRSMVEVDVVSIHFHGREVNGVYILSFHDEEVIDIGIHPEPTMEVFQLF